MTRPHVVGVPGSLRTGSYTRSGVAHALLAAEAAGAEAGLLDLRALDLPLYDPDRDEADAGDAVAVRRRIREADAVVLGSPVYHGSYSAAFRNVHDYCSFDDYEDTVVGLLAVAGGGSFGPTLEHMRATVRGVHGWVLPHQVGVRNASDRFADADAPVGQLADGTAVERTVTDDGIAERLERLGEELVAAAGIRPPPAERAADD
jgi:azobenzene reductase